MRPLLDRLSSASRAALRRLGEGGLTRLADGSRVLVRPLRPGDRERLREGIAALSFRTRYLRFHGGGPKPTERELDLLLALDGRDRVAWGAVEPRSDRGLGVARYARLEAEPTMAEFALTVIDRWQRRGLARVLLDRLARSAQAAGIERFLRGAPDARRRSRRGRRDPANNWAACANRPRP